MMIANKVISYDDLLEVLGPKRKHILLGNGFSIACDGIFHYACLYDNAVAAGLSPRAQKVFARLGTSNFEGAMRLLDDAHWVANTYELVGATESEMLTDVEVIKKTLVEAVAKSHLPNAGSVSDEKKQRALEFLREYYNVFTTNYDLLPYWVNMYDPDGPIWQDGFRSDKEEPDAPYVVFTERLGGQQGMFFLHGALHLHVSHGELRKHCWARTGKPLTQLIQEGLENRNYPLFIAEGASSGKLEQIQRSGYLWYCLDKLARIENALVVYGHALGDSDRHIVDALAMNTKLKTIAVSLFGDPASPANQAICSAVMKMQAARQRVLKKKGGSQLDVHYFKSESAEPWGAT